MALLAGAELQRADARRVLHPPQTAHGSSHVPPIQAGNDVLFVKEKGSRVVALRFDAIQDQYQSFDMSILSSHLLYDSSGAHRIVEWAFAAEPHQVIWGCRDDGVLLGFTYMREHDVYAWHRHVTDGVVESVTTVTEADGYGGYEDAVWLIVNRPIGRGERPDPPLPRAHGLAHLPDHRRCLVRRLRPAVQRRAATRYRASTISRARRWRSWATAASCPARS